MNNLSFYCIMLAYTILDLLVGAVLGVWVYTKIKR